MAGYPETHLDATSAEDDIKYLKEKVDAGADLVITQLFYDNSLFLKFVENCKEIGIEVPIIPGIMPIQSYGGFQRMTTLCKTHVPEHIMTELEEFKDDDAAVKQYGVDHCVKMCQELIDNDIKYLHFYTLNLEKSVASIINKLGIERKQKKLPWVKPTHSNRSSENVRPIFWANKPKSYIARTQDEFTNGRFGSSRSPAFGNDGDYPSMSKISKPKEKRLKVWGELDEELDVGRLILKFISGKLKQLPWSEQSVAAETSNISDDIKSLNENYIFTTNS